MYLTTTLRHLKGLNYLNNNKHKHYDTIIIASDIEAQKTRQTT